MRILVVSDTHGDLRSLIKAVDAQRKAEIIVHCGDGEEQQRFLKDNYIRAAQPEMPFGTRAAFMKAIG